MTFVGQEQELSITVSWQGGIAKLFQVGAQMLTCPSVLTVNRYRPNCGDIRAEDQSIPVKVDLAHRADDFAGWSRLSLGGQGSTVLQRSLLLANTATTKDGKSLAYAVRDEDL
ncbi:MAG: hypothetical protein ACRDHZ_08860, partial [Ktedonobacteraceae bacterium]